MVETNSMATLCSHVLTGQWSSVLPEAILYMMGPVSGVHVAALTPEAAHTIGVIVHDHDPLPPVASAFFEIARAVDAAPVIADRVSR